MAPGAVGSCGGHEGPEHVEKLHGPQGVEAASATGACACLYLGMKAAGPIAVIEEIRVPGSGMRSPNCFGKKLFIESDDIAARPKDIFVANRRFQVSTAQPSHSPSSPVEIPMLEPAFSVLVVHACGREPPGGLPRNFGCLEDQMYALERDPITGAERYRNLQTGEVSTEKPLSLGSERWDQDDMMLWTVEEVRSCGLLFRIIKCI